MRTKTLSNLSYTINERSVCRILITNYKPQAIAQNGKYEYYYR